MSREHVIRNRASRRAFLAGGSALAAPVLLSVAGCDALSTEPEGQQGQSTGEVKGKESPMLADRVKSGDLPAVEDRLPAEPMTVPAVERAGDYGGEWRSVLFGLTEAGWLNRTLGYDNLMRWESKEPGGIPEPVTNVAESIVANGEGTEYTITLRRGMKWSDGKPFTPDDIVFAQNEINNHEELSTVGIWGMTAEKVDEVTVKLVYEEPAGLFLSQQAGPGHGNLVFRPRHYLEQFHLDHNPEVEQLAKDDGHDTWVDFFNEKADWLLNPELPSIRAWLVQNAYGDSDRLRFERNPFYWKVDEDGRQLPYIDKVSFSILSDPEAAVVRASQGEIDFMERTVNTLRNKPVLAQSREQGDFRFFDRIAAVENFTVISLNLTHMDPVKREIFNNLDFRIGLSHAINRQEIIDTVFASQGEPYQVAPRQESPYYDEEFAKQYTEFDVDLANEYLDKAFPDKDGNGWRLGPDGKKIFFTIDIAPGFYPEWADTFELVKSYWNDVGIDAQPRSIDRALLYERKDGNLHDANVWEGAAGWRDDILLEARWYFPFSSESNYARGWVSWNESGGAEGDEPPEPTKQQMELYGQIHATTDTAQQDELMKEIIQIAKEQFYVIGINLYPPSYGFATNRFRNVPETILYSWIYQPPGMTSPEQYFIEAEKQ